MLTLGKSSFLALLKKNYPLLFILIGAMLVSVSIGPFSNVDTQLEFDAASGVTKWGMPFILYGHVINQPPIGFYTEALFFQIFGLSYDIGVALITLIGLGCTILVYALGKTLYGRPTATVAAALFSLTPWHLALTRSFLIDVQCLFLSLLTLLVGIYAIRKDSFKLLMISGILFAIALLTKFFAIFTLIPLTFFYLCYRKSKLKRVRVVVAYFLPALLLALLWYQIITGRGLYSAVGIDDFKNPNPVETVPSLFFLMNFLSAGMGILFLISSALSLIISLTNRRLFAKFFPFDLMCLATIFVVGGINTFLGFGLNLSAPYNNPIKYDYQFLPFFSLLAASLVGKFLLLFNSAKSKKILNRSLSSIASIGMILVIALIIVNMSWVNQYSTWDHWVFNVDQNVGYAFLNSNPIDEGSSIMWLQYLGFVVVLSGLGWASRHKIKLLICEFYKRAICEFYKRVRLWIETKNALSCARRESSCNKLV